MHMGGGLGRGTRWWNGRWARIYDFFCLLPNRLAEIPGSTRKSWTGHPIDHLLCRPRDHRFLGATKVLFEDTIGENWSAYTDHNPAEVKLAKGWVYRAPPRTPKKLSRPNWSLLRGPGEAAQVARVALAAELDRRVSDEQPTTWPELVTLEVGVARAVLGEGSCGT